MTLIGFSVGLEAPIMSYRVTLRHISYWLESSKSQVESKRTQVRIAIGCG